MTTHGGESKVTILNPSTGSRWVSSCHGYFTSKVRLPW